MGAKQRANQNEEGKTGGNRPTIGDWKPSVLFLDFKLVPESLRLCFLSFSVHMRLRIVRRLSSWFHALLLWGGGRHVYSAACRPGDLLRGRLCAGALLSYSLASTSLEAVGAAWRPRMQPLCNADVGRGGLRLAAGGCCRRDAG